MMFAVCVGLIGMKANEFWAMTVFEYSVRVQGMEFLNEKRSYNFGVVANAIAPKLADESNTTPFTFFNMPTIESFHKESEIKKSLNNYLPLFKEGKLNINLEKNKALKEEFLKFGYLNENGEWLK